MRLIRNTSPNGIGKYALIRLDKIQAYFLDRGEPSRMGVMLCDALGENKPVCILPEFVELGLPNSDEEFFVIKLRDKYAASALSAYASAAWIDGEEDLARDVIGLSERALSHPNKHKPD